MPELDDHTMGLIKHAVSEINKNYGKYLKNSSRRGPLNQLLPGKESDLKKVFKDRSGQGEFEQTHSLVARRVGVQLKLGTGVRAWTVWGVLYDDNAMAHDYRVIYFRERPPTYGTVVHELFHWVCHRDFYEKFHQGDVKVGRVDEGITEFLSRKEAPWEDRSGVYDDYHDEVKRFCSDRSHQEQVLEAYFQGKNMDSLKKQIQDSRRHAVLRVR
jgi:hypothetical protein